jgi:hypothetical protein
MDLAIGMGLIFLIVLILMAVDHFRFRGKQSHR